MTSQLSKLGNGLTVVTVPGDASATALLFVGAGSRYETRETAGTAHFLEHLFFKGTPKRPTNLELATEIDSLGCGFNAFTSKESTAYFIRGAAEYMDQAVEIIADLLKNALIPPDEVERERGVILQEMRMYHDSPTAWSGRLAERLVYGDTPMGWDVVGFEEVIGGVSRDRICAYREAFYAPGRMILALAGPVDHVRALELAGRHFGDLRPAPLSGFEPGRYGEERTAQDHRDVQQASIQITWPGPSIADGETALVETELATALLGGSMSSRLFSTVRERQGLCYSIHAGLSSNSDVGRFNISTGVDPSKAEQAVTSIVRELESFAAEGVTEEEAAKARALLKGRYVMSRESSMTLALTACHDLLQWGRVREREEIFAMVDAAGPAELQRAAKTWFDPAEIRLAVVGPPSVSADALLQAGQGAGL